MEFHTFAVAYNYIPLHKLTLTFTYTNLPFHKHINTYTPLQYLHMLHPPSKAQPGNLCMTPETEIPDRLPYE